MSGELSPKAVDRLLAAAAEPEGDLASGAQDPRIAARYRLIRELGRGGMGIVYEAYDRELARRIALKVMTSGKESVELRARFAREARAAACLSHPNIAAVHDATPNWIAMQLIEGRPLSEVARDERKRIVALVRDAARAVQHAHDHGIIHRDLKPSNLLVAGDHVWVVDFGLAKGGPGDPSISVSGAILGTPSFMAPEQAAGRHDGADARTDVYGLGATLYACLAGRPPFEERELVKLLREVVEREPPPPRLERDLDVIILKCLAKLPSERFASAADLADDLDRWLRGAPIRSQPPSLAYHSRKLLYRHRRLLQAAAVAAIATLLIVVPWVLRERAASAAARDALDLSTRVSTLLSNAESLRRGGALGAANERLDQGIRVCDEFLARHDLARVHQFRGRLLRARGRRDAARSEFDQALELDPKLAGARFERGLLLADSNDDEARARARADLGQLDGGGDAAGSNAAAIAEALGLREIDLLFGKAVRARLDGDLTREQELLDQVLLIDPTHLEATLALARLSLAKDDDDAAFELAIGAVNLQRPPAPDVGASRR